MRCSLKTLFLIVTAAAVITTATKLIASYVAQTGHEGDWERVAAQFISGE
jgi:uncharacterized membrane protein YhiD involved in acid resistance